MAVRRSRRGVAAVVLVVAGLVATATLTSVGAADAVGSGAVPLAATSSTWPTSTTTPAGSCAVPATFDGYDGFTGLSLPATGYFRTAQIDGRWWLVTPDGHPFWSSGVNHVTVDGTPDRNGLAVYRDTVLAKYGSAEAWAAAEQSRMASWGYNSLGAWSQVELFPHQPYTVLLSVTGSNFSTGEMADLWDPSWEASVNSALAGQAARRHDPYLIGYWFDNELHWGPDWRPLHLFEEYLARPASAPGKQALVAWLQARYGGDFAAFAADVTTDATDWATLASPTPVHAFTPTGGADTRSAWMGAVAERYFSYTSAALKAVDPDHLNLGARFMAQVAGVPVLEAAARHVDVVSFNLYPLIDPLPTALLGADPTYRPVDGPLTAQAEVLGHKPVLISEWSFRAADSGLPNTWPPLFPTLATQAERAAAYERFVQGLLGTDFVVGQHWFEFADEPPAGRFDGEDSNFGLVSLTDEPWPEVVGISRTMHDCAYARLLQVPASTTTSPSSTTATTSAPTTSGPTTSAPTTSGSAGTSSTNPSTTRPGATVATAVAAAPRFTG